MLPNVLPPVVGSGLCLILGPVMEQDIPEGLKAAVDIAVLCVT